MHLAGDKSRPPLDPKGESLWGQAPQNLLFVGCWCISPPLDRKATPPLDLPSAQVMLSTVMRGGDLQRLSMEMSTPDQSGSRKIIPPKPPQPNE